MEIEAYPKMNHPPGTKVGIYVVEAEVGHGTYGTVFKAVDPNNGNIVALKEIPISSQDEGVPSTAIREIALLKQLQHPNIVKFHDVVHLEQSLVMVFEFLEHDLTKLMKVKTKAVGLNQAEVKSFLYQLLNGIAKCHQQKMLHRDLKPQNLLITSDQKLLKIADFGLARSYGIPVKNFAHEVVTLWYRSPDILMGSINYSTQVDIWSVGCIFAEMVNHAPLFPGQHEEDQLLKIFKAMGTPDPEEWPEMQTLTLYQPDMQKYPGVAIEKLCPKLDPAGLDLLSKMLQCNPEKRISAKEAMKHPYLEDVPEEIKQLK